MPQLDITINLIWYVCSILGIGVLYLQNVYVYLPFFIRYWKFRNYYSLSMVINTLDIYSSYLNFISGGSYYVSSCTAVPYGLVPEYNYSGIRSYSLEVLECQGLGMKELQKS